MTTVLITGTSTGIGLATALACGRAGHRVAATMRNPAGAPALAEAAARERLAITVIPMDVDTDASVRDGMARIDREIGPIDVLVNNAGIERIGSVEELPLAEFRAVMETNYFGVIRCCQAVLPAMRQRRSGCIINVSSVAGHVAVAPMAAYTASKFALEALSECLAQEVKAFNIRVAVVEPGIIDTQMARNIGTAASPEPVFAAAPRGGPVHHGAQVSGVTDGGRRQDSRDRRGRHPTAPASGGSGRRAVPGLAAGDERRGVGGAGRHGRRRVVRSDRSRLRHGRAAPGMIEPQPI